MNIKSFDLTMKGKDGRIITKTYPIDVDEMKPEKIKTIAIGGDEYEVILYSERTGQFK